MQFRQALVCLMVIASFVLIEGLSTNVSAAVADRGVVPARRGGGGGGRRGGGGGRRGGGGGNNAQNAAQQKAEQARRAAATRRAAEISAAEKEQQAAKVKLNEIVARLRATFLSSGENKAVDDNLRQAQNAHDAAVKPVMTALADNSDYKAALADKETADKAVQDARASTDSTDEQIADLATKSLAARMQVTKMETDALAANPAVTDAKAKLTAAQTAYNDMQQKFEASIKQDAEWLAAKKSLDDATHKLATLDPGSSGIVEH